MSCSEDELGNSIMTDHSGTDDHIDILSKLLFSSEFPQSLFSANAESLEQLLALANSHHVILRTFPEINQRFEEHNNPNAPFVRNAIQDEKARISHALASLETICDALIAAGYPVTVIKSLEHYPDLGSDLDLFSNAAPAQILRIMRQ